MPSRAFMRRPESSAREPSAGSTRSSGLGASRGAGNRAIGRMLGRTPTLRLGAADTHDEHDADRVADAVLAGRPASRPRSVPGTGAPIAESIAGQIHAARGGGRALPGTIRRTLGRSMGVDLSRVRVHTDARAHGVSRALGAEAATTGHDIFFRRGAFRPETRRGMHTLVHEVAHTVQSGGDPGLVQRKKWIWDRKWGETEYRWCHEDDDGSHVLAEIGEGRPNDRWDDETRIYSQYNAVHRRYLDDGKRYIVSPGFATREGLRANAGEVLARCQTLADLAGRLSTAGYNFSTVPATFIMATKDFRTFRAQTGMFGDTQATLACRLALRDLEDDTASMPLDGALYMKRAKAREETSTKMNRSRRLRTWKQFDESFEGTDFGKWALTDAKEPGLFGTMNCWESVLFAAYKATHLDRETIKEKYLEGKSLAMEEAGRALLAGTEIDTSVEGPSMRPVQELLTRGDPKTYDPRDPDSVRPLRGDIVVVGSFGNHVMLARGNPTGEPEVLSCWPQSEGDSTRVRMQPISDFIGAGTPIGTIKLYRPFWA